MARISLDPPNTTLNRIVNAYSRRRFGTVLEPGAAMQHNRRVLLSYFKFEQSIAKQKTLDPTIKALAVMAAAHHIGCSWCMDFGFWESHNRGIDPAKLREVPTWRESTRFSEVERLAMQYAEQMSELPISVNDDLVAALSRHLSNAQLVELTMMIAVENQRARFNTALGLHSQGFAERCEVPSR